MSVLQGIIMDKGYFTCKKHSLIKLAIMQA